MTTRFVMLKLTDEYATDAGRAEVVRHSLEVLPSIPGVTGAQAGGPSDPASARSWDISLVIEFDRVEDIDPYIVHPIHRTYVDGFLAPRVECKKAWNFDLEP